MRGIIVYGRDGYADGGEFVAQAESLCDAREDIAFAIADDIAILIEDGEVVVELPDGTRLSKSSGDLPRWAMMRTSDWQAALALEQIGIKCFPSSDYIQAASDKVLSHILMAPYLRSLDTICRRGTLGMKRIPAPCMVKASTGFGGKAVKRVEDPADGDSFAREIERDGAYAMFQELAASPDDLRVYIMGGKVMYAILRRASEGSDKANFCQGATGEEYELDDEQMRQIEGAIKAFPDNLGFISVDFLFDKEGRLVFNEMNCFPGLLGPCQMGWQEGFVEEYANEIERMCSSE